MKGELISENAYALILCITKNLEPEIALNKCGVEIPYIRPLINDNQKEMINIYYNEFNMSLADIGKLYDCSKWAVKEFLKRVDIPIKPQGRCIGE